MSPTRKDRTRSLPSRLARYASQLVAVRPEEARPLIWSCVYFFCLLCSYYILRPVRDEMGLAGGVEQLPWLYLGTLGAMLIANPIFAALVMRFPRRRFIPIANRFFIACMALFYVLIRFAPESAVAPVARAFFVWVSVFNLFVVSIFWGFMADLYKTEQGKRLFGLIGVGGTAGAIVGAGLTAFLVELIGSANLLLISALVLEGAVQCVRRLAGLFHLGTEPATVFPAVSPTELTGSASGRSERALVGLVNGIRLVFSSRYLAAICLYMFLYTLTSTFLYFEQANIISETVTGRAARTAVFARIDLLVNTLTILVQLFLTGRIIRLLGLGVTLALLPALTMVGFAALGLAPGLYLVAGFQVLRRAANYAVARPAREVLYTVLGREEKYKAKSFIDTFVYRTGDAIGAWSFGVLTTFVTGLSGVAFLAVPISAVWISVGLMLGRRQRAIVAAAQQRS